MELAGWLLRGIAKKLPFLVDTAGASTWKKENRRQKQMEKVILWLAAKWAKGEVFQEEVRWEGRLTCSA